MWPTQRRTSLRRLATTGVIGAVVVFVVAGTTPAAAAAVDLRVESPTSNSTRTVRTGDLVGAPFTVHGRPAAGSDVVLDVALGDSFEFVDVSPSAGGPALPCVVDPAEPQWATCRADAGGGPLELTVDVRAVRPGIHSQYVQLTASVAGVDDPTPGDNGAGGYYQVLSADLEVLSSSAGQPTVVRGADFDEQDTNRVDLVVATTQSVPVEVALSRDPSSAPLDGLRVRRWSSSGTSSLLTCRGDATAAQLTCPLGTVVPGTAVSLTAEVTTAAATPVGSTATLHATVQPAAGSGSGLTATTADVDVVVAPDFELGATVSAAGVTAGPFGSATSVDVPVGAPRSLQVVVTNAGPDPAPATTVELALRRHGQGPSSGDDPLIDLSASATTGTVVQAGTTDVSWSAGDVPPGSSRVLDLQVSATRMGYTQGGYRYAEDLVITGVRADVGAGSVGSRASAPCSAQQNEAGRCWVALATTRSPTAAGRAGSNDDTDADGFADALGVDDGGQLRFYPNGYGVEDDTPFTEGFQVGSGWQGLDQASAGDVDGDGDADIVATDASGNLWLYDNGLVDGAPAPFDSGQLIGGGWQGYPQLTTGDISGDGAADLIATDPGGRLRYFPNTRSAGADHRPYSAGTTFGGGWQGYTHITAGDISGDGAADLIATGPDGRLWYFPNNSGSNPGNVPFVHGIVIGRGWQGFRQVQTADMDGDGVDDLLAVSSDGTLLQFINTGGANAGRPPFVASEQVGVGWDVFRLLL